MTRRVAISPIPMTIQFSMGRRIVKPAEKSKAGLSRPSYRSHHELRLFGSDCVLGSLGDAELYHGLGLDLNGLAGLRIASDAGFAVRFHQPAEAGHNEHAVLL